MLECSSKLNGNIRPQELLSQFLSFCFNTVFNQLPQPRHHRNPNHQYRNSMIPEVFLPTVRFRHNSLRGMGSHH